MYVVKVKGQIKDNCNGGCDGATDLTVAGGTSPYTFTWSNGFGTEDITGLCPDTFGVTVTDGNGCTASDTVIITEPVALTAAITGTNLTCNGACDGAADLTVAGGTLPYSYDWSSGETTEDLANICAGTYIVDVTDTNGCTISDTIIITQPFPLATTIAGTDLSCYLACDGAADLTVSGGTLPYLMDSHQFAYKKDGRK